MNRYEFIAINIHTDRRLQGSCKDIAEIIGVVPATVNKSAIQGKLINGAWEINKINAKLPEVECDENFVREWNEAVKPFREISRRRRNRNATDNATTEV